jgi:SAM-dependent methyltransferase
MKWMKKAARRGRDPGAFREALRNRLAPLRYWAPGGYRASRYWADRLSRFRFDLKGVGNAALSSAENERMYRRAGEVFLSLCQTLKIEFSRTEMLDIGCGTGYYAGIFREQGGKSYLGVDVADVLFPELRRRFPGFSFLKLDVAAEALPGTFGLISMIDVTQHITSAEGFSFALRNLREHLAPGGTFTVTSWLDGRARRSFYEVSRAFDVYHAAFPGCRFSPPLPFRDKWIFGITAPSAP